MTLHVTGYADRWNVKQGETVRFMISVQGNRPYTARVARVHCGDPNPKGPGYREDDKPCAITGTHEGAEQPIRLGSWVDVPRADLPAGPVAFRATVRPTLVKGAHAVLAWRGADGAELVLGIDAEGAFAAVSDANGAGGRISTATPLTLQSWHDISCAWDPAGGTLSVAQRPHQPRYDRDEKAGAKAQAKAGALSGTGQVTLAARRGADDIATAHFNGKLEAPRILALGDAQAALTSQAAPLAAWDFAIGIASDTITDTGPGGFDGRCVNLPTRAMTGATWKRDTQRWTDAHDQWAAIHFHDDDIGDAGWSPSLSLTIPDDWPSGVYALHLESDGHRDNIPFHVRARIPGSQAKVAFLAPTFSYTIYGQFARPNRQAALRERSLAWGALPQSADGHPEYGKATYNWHTDGSGICYASMRRPMVDKRVNHIQTPDPSPDGSGTYWLAADSYITDMLDREGIAYEVVTDHDLHAEGVDALKPYNVVMTGQHPEYHSDQTLDAIAGYIQSGGRFMYLGGNGFYWKVAVHQDGPWALEVRRAEGGIRLWATEPGESYHSFDGSYGGLWRRLGRPPQSIVGVGFSTQGEYAGYPYTFGSGILDPRVAFLREGMEEIAQPGSVFGERGFMGGGAGGHELDRADISLGTPHHAIVLATCIVPDETYTMVNEERYDHTYWPHKSREDIARGDIVFFEAPNGGAVLSVGSMNYIGAMPVDGYTCPAARLVLNAIRRFADPAPFAPTQPCAKPA